MSCNDCRYRNLTDPDPTKRCKHPDMFIDEATLNIVGGPRIWCSKEEKGKPIT